MSKVMRVLKPPALLSAYGALYRVSPVASGSVWLSGEIDHAPTPILLHGTGSGTWATHSLPYTTDHIRVVGTADTNLWSTEQDATAAHLHQWAGSFWTPYGTRTGTDFTSADPRVPAADTVGWLQHENGGTATIQVVVSGSSTWHSTTIPGALEPGDYPRLDGVVGEWWGCGTGHALGSGDDFAWMGQLDDGGVVHGHVDANLSTARALQSFSASSGNLVWVVGDVDTGAGSPASWAAIWYWDGSTWTRTLFTLPTGVDGHLFGIHGVAPNDLWAVGRTIDTSFAIGHVLFLHWNGSAWSQVTITGEPTSTTFVSLYDVRMRTSTDGWAVGERDGLMLAYHWDGTAWSEVPVSY